jgi:5-methylcytosine-specific restriction enzyme subunit McrC
MLSYAYQTLRETGYDNVAEEGFDNIHDLFAAILIRGVGNQIKRGLHKDYIPQEEPLSGLRGQIRVSETIKRQSMIQSKLVCAYDEFTENSYHNQVLKSVMFLLLRHGNVKFENKKALRKLLLYFNAVDEVLPQSIRWDALKYHSNNAAYRMLINICRFVVRGLLMTTETGVHRLATWLQDEEMYRLFERFVLSYYQKHHPNYAPRATYIGWDISEDADTKYLPVMKTDITMTNGDKQLIIDTKYYGQTMQVNSRFDSTTFISGNLYQIFTYVKNSDHGSTGNVAGVLLYAKTDEAITPNSDFTIGGNKISLKTIDLNRAWNFITEQLEALCGWLEAEECA